MALSPQAFLCLGSAQLIQDRAGRFDAGSLLREEVPSARGLLRGAAFELPE